MEKTVSTKAILLTLRAVRFINVFADKLHTKNCDVILCYHDVGDVEWEFSVTKQQFDEHINMLKESFNIVGISQILDGRNKINKPRLAITFDDGYAGVYKNAYPILSKYKVSATVFVMEGNSIDSKATYKSDFLNKSQIEELVSVGWEIGFHTTSHKDVSNLGDKELKQEIIQDKKDLEKALGIKIKYFAYPFGRYNRKAIKVVQESGFDAAFTVYGNRVSNRMGKKYELSRITVSKHISQADLKTLLTPLGIFTNKVFTYLLRVKDDYWRFAYE